MYPEAFDLTEVFRCAPRLSALHTATHCVAHTCRGLLEARPAVILVFGTICRAEPQLAHACVWGGSGRAFCSRADQKSTDTEVHVPREALELLDARVRSELLGTGPDAEWRAQQHPDALSRTWGMRRQVLEFLRCPKPLISAVNGLAIGGGANIALFFMDLAYCMCDFH